MKRRLTRNQKYKLAKMKRELQAKVVKYSTIEQNAEQQGKAIVKHNKLAIHAPRLNFTYMLDGFAVPSGKRHRKLG